MKNKIILVLIIFSVVLSVLFLVQRRASEELDQKPLPNEKEYTAGVNQWLEEKKKRKEELKNNKAQALEARSKIHWEKVKQISDSMVEEIRFYGKVVDQYGSPVNGALVEYEAGSAYLAEGTGVSRSHTGSDGIFVTTDAKGKSLSIRSISKPGYEFKFDETKERNFENYKRFDDSVLWEDYTEKSPYIFRLWKVEGYQKTKVGSERLFLFVPDGSDYTFDFSAPKKGIFKKGDHDGDLKVVFNRTEESWDLVITAYEGGLQEAEGVYLNLAPEESYQEIIEYNFLRSESEKLNRMYFIKIRNGEMYGKVRMRIDAYRRDKAAVYLSYVLNLEKGRNLAVKNK